MADKTKIEWTDATWNPITGCTVVSPGCTNCYAMKLAGSRMKNHWSRKGLTQASKAGPVWNGKVRFNEQWLDQPLHWRKPRRIFVCAHGDLFHEDVPDAWIDIVFAIMALAPQHTFQVLTKRADRMLNYIIYCDEISAAETGNQWPLPNVHLGVSTEDQTRADKRIPLLLRTPAAVRFISAEPLLGPIDLKQTRLGHMPATARLDQVIVGGESGPGARPMHPDWARLLRDQCEATGVAFNFKQWGEWLPGEFGAPPDMNFQDRSWMDVNLLPDINCDDQWAEDWATDDFEGHAIFKRVGKKAAGRLLDGREWNGVPK
jgi:protein gp37